MTDKLPVTEIAKRSWSEGIWMYLFHDSDLQKGKKAVLVVLAQDRNDPAFEAMTSEFHPVEKELDEVHDLKIFFEDHPGGLLHEKFPIPPQSFHWYLIDIHGDEVADSEQPISVADVMMRLQGRHPDPVDRTQMTTH